MWGNPGGKIKLACPKCQHTFPASEVVFLCPEPLCPSQGQPLALASRGSGRAGPCSGRPATARR